MTTEPAIFQPLGPERLSAAAIALAAANVENTVLRADMAALVEAAAVLNGVLAASGDCLKVLSLDGRIQFVNETGYRLMEASGPDSLRGHCWTELWPDNPLAEAAIVAARAGNDSNFVGTAATQGGTIRDWDVRVTPVRSAAAKVTQILVISRDVTEQLRIGRQKVMLANELEHRVNNILALVAAIAQQTIRPPASLTEIKAGFVARVQALGRAQAVLTRTNWERADLGLVVNEALQPHRIAGNARQFHVGGPPILISGKRVLALVLALHELATNAAKYGALSVATGTVYCNWRCEGETKLVIEWREQGGPAVVQPVRRGFGSKLIDSLLAAEFEGHVDLAYAPTGLTLVLTAPIFGREEPIAKVAPLPAPR